MSPRPQLFISYRRTQGAAVGPAVDALRAAGVDCFVDVDSIDPLADFPERIRQAIDASHAMLVWWSADYGDSEHCLAELRRAWQHARRHSSDVGRRIWVLNAEPTAHHVFAGELNASNFLAPPAAGAAPAWARGLKDRLDALLPEGPLADERITLPLPALRGVATPNARFTGRGATLLHIHSKLFAPRIGAAAMGAAVWLHGMAGLGKTEVAAKYAQDFAQAFPGGVFWLGLAGYSPHGRLDEDEAKLAWSGALDAAFAQEPHLQASLLRDAAGRPLSPGRARESIARWLASAAPDGAEQPYLWILDNVPHLSPLDVRDRVLDFWRAPTAAGRTLVTTRDARIATGFTDEPLEALGEVDALRLLSRFRPVSGAEQPAARDLAAEVGRHTIALMLLGERVRRDGDYARTLATLREVGLVDRLEQLAVRMKQDLGDAARSVVASFELSIAPLGGDAKRLLALAAACAPNEAIPRALLRNAFGGDAADDDFADAADALVRASLLGERRGDDAVDIHPLVAEVEGRLTGAAPQRAGEAVGQALLGRLSAVMDIRRHAALADDVVHARHLAQELSSITGVRLGNRVGRFERVRGQFNAARLIEERTWRRARKVLGDHHPETLICLNNLADTLNAEGDLRGARRWQGQLLRSFRRALGRNHPHTLTAANNLAATLLMLGKVAGANALLKRVIERRRATLGDEHPDTLTSRSIEAEILRRQGNLVPALVLQKELLKVRRRVLGEDHQSTLLLTANLAGTLAELGDLRGARAEYRRLLKASRRVLGADHPDTLRALSSLAAALKRQGHLRRARPLEEAALAQRRRVLGDAHPDTLGSIDALASTLAALGDADSLARLIESLPPKIASQLTRAMAACAQRGSAAGPPPSS